MHTIELEPVATNSAQFAHLEGTFFQPDDSWLHLSPKDEYQEVRVICKNTKKVLCHVLRSAISLDLCATAVRSFRAAAIMVSTNRGSAAGTRHRNLTAHYERGVPAHSSIVGYIDSTHHNRPCRLTAFSRDHIEEYQSGIPFLSAINDCFKRCVRDAWTAQYNEAHQTDFVIGNTAFSTVTVNFNFRTALHKDVGDYEHGFGNLVVCQDGIIGGWLLFPRYKVAVELATGDFMAMDVHEWHCNSEIIKTHPEAYRMSFVCYLRNRMKHCNQINNRLRQLPKNTEEICKHIFERVGEELPQKIVTGVGPQGFQWYEYRGSRFTLTYKNKRYTLLDHNTNKKINNLLPSWDYVQTL